MNLGLFLYNLGIAGIRLGSILKDTFNKEVSIGWISTVLNTFGASIELPETISLSYILTSASAALLITFIIYRLVK